MEEIFLDTSKWTRVRVTILASLEMEAGRSHTQGQGIKRKNQTNSREPEMIYVPLLFS